MSDLIRKRSSSACPKICWKPDCIFTKFGKWLLNNFSIDNLINVYNINMLNIVIFFFLSWLCFLRSGWSKGHWICTILAWLSHHSELFIRKPVVGKGKVCGTIYLWPSSLWCKSVICLYCWNINGCRADRHMPSYAKKIVDMYNKNGEIEKMLSEKWF